MSSCIINKKHFPTVFVTFNGIVQEDDIQNIMDEWENNYNNKTNFYFIFNALNCGNISFTIIFKIIAFIKKMKQSPIHYLQRTIIMLDKSMTVERTTLRFIFNIQSPCAPVYIVDSLEEGLNIHSLLSKDQPIPPNILHYK